MPTTHVTRESHDTLQEIANSLLKARKVVVVTGAGISTNSGIPDFRSENGLYSLIQAQFDAAAAQARAEVEGVRRGCDTDDTEEEQPAKRQRRASEDTIEVVQETHEFHEEIREEIEVREQVREVVQVGVEVARDEIECQADVICVQGPGTDDSIIVEGDSDGGSRRRHATTAPALPTTRRFSRSSRSCITVAQPPTSPLSSPPPDDIDSPFNFKKRHRSRIDGMTTVPPSSSPLSSPPPGLFDPYDATSSDEHSAHSTSPSETDDTSPSTNPFSASQSSGRALPNMKGKDMFDASIWSDPLRTSIFYQFATSLRQKSKDAEPTVSHRFIKHLRDRGKLVRCYTQNIDQIEEKVGLSTCLKDGPGNKGRFSRKSTATINQLAMMVEEAADPSIDKSQQSSDESSQQTQPSSVGTRTPNETDQSPSDTPKADQLRRDLRPGVECVYLHGSLERLRCFLCGRVCDWEDREMETLSGKQPECPFCVCATMAREEKGKRALGVGKLRPDIVLYGEEHPNSHLISPIVTHDLALYPDILLILGTSLRVHGLKFMVREFAKAVHSKGGKVVFVNFTKPPESSWGDVIDYWIEWDCDAWVGDLQGRIPGLWAAPELPKTKREESNKKKEERKKREEEDGGGKKRVRKYAKNPSALRPAKAVGCVQVLRILDGLHILTGAPPRTPMVVRETKGAITVRSIDAPKEATRSTTSDTAKTSTGDTTTINVEETPKAKRPRGKPRKSAPGMLQSADAPSTPSAGRMLRSGSIQPVAPPFQLIKRQYILRALMEPEPEPSQSQALLEPQVSFPRMESSTPSLRRLRPFTSALPMAPPSTPSLRAPHPTISSAPKSESSATPARRLRLSEPNDSIGAFIKSNPRNRKRKLGYGETTPSHTQAGTKSEPEIKWSQPIRGYAYALVPDVELEEPQEYSPPHTRSGHKRPTPMEPSRMHQALPEQDTKQSPQANNSSPSPSLLEPLRPMSNNPQRAHHMNAYDYHDALQDHFARPRPTPPHSPITPPPLQSKRITMPPRGIPRRITRFSVERNTRPSPDRITRSLVGRDTIPPVERNRAPPVKRNTAPPVDRLARSSVETGSVECAPPALRPLSKEEQMVAETMANMSRAAVQGKLRDWGERWGM